MQDYKLSTSNVYADIARAWAMVVKRNESGTWIFSPLGGIHFLVQQFLEDTILQQELFQDQIQQYLFVSVIVEQESTASFESHLYAAMKEQQVQFEQAESIEQIYKQIEKNNQKLVIFLEGVEWAIKSGKLQILDEVYRLTLRKSNVKVLLLVGVDITDPSISGGDFGRYSTILQNVAIYPRKDHDEAAKFKQYLEENWDVHPNEGQRQWIDENCGSSFRFIKEVYRQLQNNPKLTAEEMSQLPTLKFRTRVLLDSFLEDQRAVILRVATHEIVPQRLEHQLQYLKTVEWILEGDGKLYLSVPYIEKYIQQEQRESDSSAGLTPTEKKVFDYLKKNEGTIISRNILGDIIWENQVSDKYSDWAIDQLMHRLKRKLALMDNKLTIKTVRGQGFILQKA